jgi:DUF1365 family protein
MHRRVRPRVHVLRYRLFMLLLDLDEVDALAGGLRLFSRNGWNLFSFYDRDHGARGKEPLRAQVEARMRAAGLAPDGGPIRLLTMPRMLGFVFNPVSVYFCHRRGGALDAIIYEVNNTYGERHDYVLPVEDPSAVPIRQRIGKNFHVSPFMGMEMDYAFRVVPPDARLGLAITGGDAEGPLITAAVSARRRELTDRALLGAFFAYPLMTLKVVGGILWEAARLWVKGVPTHAKPPPPGHFMSSPKAAPSLDQTRETACT